MKNITLYIALLMINTLGQPLLAQQGAVPSISWQIAGRIPPAASQSRSLGLAGAAIGALGKVLIIAGGTNFPGAMPWDGGQKKYYDEIFLYRKTPGGLALEPSVNNIGLPIGLAYAAVCSTPKGLLVVGGENENGPSSAVLLLSLVQGKLKVASLRPLPSGLANASLAAIGNMVYLAGGETKKGATDQFLALDLDRPHLGWKRLVGLPQAVSHSVLLNIGNKVYLVGGRKTNIGGTSTLYASVYAFDVKAGRWTAKSPLPYPISAASGIQTARDVLIFSGDRGGTFHQAELLIAAIAAERDPLKREMLNQQKIRVQQSHPGFSRAVLRYDPSGDSWKELENTMPYGTVTTTAVLMGNDVVIAGGEVRAGVRTADILIGKLNQGQ